MTTPTRDELLKELDWAIVNDFDGPRFGILLINLRDFVSAHQAQAEPADATFIGRVYVDQLDGKRTAVLNQSAAALPDMTRIYTAPPSSDQTWNEAIEAAAAICDAQATVVTIGGEGEYNDGRSMAATVCASMIRALARPSQAQEQSKSVSGAVDELPPLPLPLEIDWPQLNSHALGCGVEDRGLRNRYECAEYGWQDGVDMAASCVPEEIFTAEQVQDYARAAIELSRAQQAPAVSAMREFAEWFAQRNVEATGKWRAAVEDAQNHIDALLSQPAAAPVSEQTTQEKS